MNIYCLGLKKENDFLYLKKPIILKDIVNDVGRLIYEKFSPELLVLFKDVLISYGKVREIKIINRNKLKEALYETVIENKRFIMFDFTENFDKAFEEFKEYLELYFSNITKNWDWDEVYDYFLDPDTIYFFLKEVCKNKRAHYIFYESALFYKEKKFELDNKSAIILIEL